MSESKTTLEGLIKKSAGDIFSAFDFLPSFSAKLKSMEVIADAVLKAHDLGMKRSRPSLLRAKTDSYITPNGQKLLNRKGKRWQKPKHK